MYIQNSITHTHNHHHQASSTTAKTGARRRRRSFSLPFVLFFTPKNSENGGPAVPCVFGPCSLLNTHTHTHTHTHTCSKGSFPREGPLIHTHTHTHTQTQTNSLSLALALSLSLSLALSLALFLSLSGNKQDFRANEDDRLNQERRGLPSHRHRYRGGHGGQGERRQDGQSGGISSLQKVLSSVCVCSKGTSALV